MSNGIKYNEYKVSKAQRKRDAKALKEKERQQRMANEEKNGAKEDNVREIETNKLKSILLSRQLSVFDIPSDGDCMYKAIEHQLSFNSIRTNIQELRTKTSEYMSSHKLDFIPFLTSAKTGDLMTDEEFDDYCLEVRKSGVWGSQLELRALSHVYETPIEVIQAEGVSVTIGTNEYNHKQPLLLSYHRHAYQLGEHYNSVIKL